jgi:hypothetical protein
MTSANPSNNENSSVKNGTIKYQIRNRMFAELKDYNPLLIKELVLKDFQRLEKLINLDLSISQLDFDYSLLDELSQTLLVDVPLTHQKMIVSYLESNFYQITPIGGLADPKIRVNALSHLMEKGDVFVYNGSNLVFDTFGTKYRGYLDESPGRPGLHYDYETLICHNLHGETISIKGADFSFVDNPAVETKMLALGPEWKRGMIEDHSFIGSLPPTKYYEGDVVTINDEKHPNFCFDETANQCLVFRALWGADPLIYQIKLPNKELVDATAEQLTLQAKGVTRLFYNGSPPLQWKDLKSEAEFYLLLGLFMYHYNPETDSYVWTMAQAKKAIRHGDGHGLLRWKGSNFLISYMVEDNSPFKPENVADATLVTDLMLTL